MGKSISTKEIFTAVTIAASGNSLSAVTDLTGIVGYTSLQVAVTGDGTCKFEYLLSNNGTDYLEPTGAVDIAASITKTSGPGSNGKDIYYFNPEMARFIKIKITETGGANTVTVTATIAIQ